MTSFVTQPEFVGILEYIDSDGQKICTHGEVCSSYEAAYESALSVAELEIPISDDGRPLNDSYITVNKRVRIVAGAKTHGVSAELHRTH